jgi:hypothetical protein
MGDYYDCNGTLLQSDAQIGTSGYYKVVHGTGDIFSGGIGGGGGYPLCNLTGTSPARECRVNVDTTPVKRGGWNCNPWPAVPSSNPDNLGKPKCVNSAADPVNVATGNNFDETLDLRFQHQGYPSNLKDPTTARQALMVRWDIDGHTITIYRFRSLKPFPI